MFAKRKKGVGRTDPAPVLEIDDRLTGDRGSADLRQTHAIPAMRAPGFAEGTRSPAEMLAAADERDALADARDLAAEKRDQDRDLAELLSNGTGYGDDWPARRAAALDREYAKQDRVAARLDLAALVDQLALGEAGRSVGADAPD